MLNSTLSNMANNPKASMEIPGYYWDNNTRRYYKEDPAHPRPIPQVFPTVVQSKNFLETISTPKNMLAMLKKRELGLGKCNGHSFENFITTRSLQHLKCIKELKMTSRQPTNSSTDVTFLKGGENSMYLELSTDCIYTLQQKMHFFSLPKKSPTLRFFQSSPFSTVDMCEGLRSGRIHSTFVVISDSNLWRTALWKHPTRNPGHFDEDTHSVSLDESEAPIWCCNKNDFTKKFILGKQNKIFILQYCSRQLLFRPIRGEVRSAQFDKQGNLIYAGLHTGHFEMIDLRTDESVFRTSLHNRGIDEIVPVFDERQLICGAFDGMLCNVS